MEIVFRRLSNDRHRLSVHRAGSTESADLETRSFLLHDLVHLAVESELPIPDGFWGTLAAGASMTLLAEGAMAGAAPGLVLAETLTGPMQSLWRGRLSREDYLRMLGPQLGPDPADFVERTCAALRRLEGHWKGTRFGEEMRLRWPLSSAPDRGGSRI